MKLHEIQFYFVNTAVNRETKIKTHPKHTFPITKKKEQCKLKLIQELFNHKM